MLSFAIFFGTIYFFGLFYWYCMHVCMLFLKHFSVTQVCILYEDCATFDDSSCDDCISGSADCSQFPCFIDGLRYDSSNHLIQCIANYHRGRFFV